MKPVDHPGVCTAPPRASDANAVAQLLAELVAEVRGLRADLARGQSHQGNGLTRADVDTLSPILPAAGGVFGPETFATRDLLEDESPALRVVTQGLTAKRLGKLLAKAEGIPVAGFVVRRAGGELNVALWRVEQVVRFPEV